MCGVGKGGKREEKPRMRARNVWRNRESEKDGPGKELGAEEEERAGFRACGG